MMRVEFTAYSPKMVAMTALAAVAAATGLIAGYLHHSATAAAAGYSSAGDEYAEDVALAAKFRKMSAEAMVFSADPKEARSSTFLQKAVMQNGVKAPNIHSDSEERSGNLTKIRTHVDCDGTTLASIVGFMRAVESGRPNLALLSVRMERQDGPDTWNARIVYLALVRAK